MIEKGDYQYSKAAITEYIRWLKEYKLPTQPKLNQVLWKMMVREKDYVGIKQLLQFKVLDDSLELAKKLVDIGTNKNLT